MEKVQLSVTIDGNTYSAPPPKFDQYRAYVHYMRERELAVKERNTDDLIAEMELIAALFASADITAEKLKTQLSMADILELRTKYPAFISQEIPAPNGAKNG